MQHGDPGKASKNLIVALHTKTQPRTQDAHAQTVEKGIDSNDSQKSLFTQKHNPGPKTHKQAQTVEKGETATTVRSQRWVPGRRMR